MIKQGHDSRDPRVAKRVLSAGALAALVAACDVATAPVQPTEEPADARAAARSGPAASGAVVRQTYSLGPLLVVNGVRMDRDSFMSVVIPGDISRIEVTKGKRATAAWGEEAAGGVIEIFMRAGAAGDTEAEEDAGAGGAGVGQPSGATGDAAAAQNGILLLAPGGREATIGVGGRATTIRR